MTDQFSCALWRDVSLCFELPAALQDWLLDQGSLTRRLTAQASGDFAVQPLAQGWQVLRADECLALNLPQDSVGWVREVFLLGRQTPWVFARSVAGRAALEAAAFDLSSLGSRSLGELLFSQQGFSRGALELCQYPQTWLPHSVAQPDLWARRSCFGKEALGVLVAEVFLPALWQHAAL